MEKIDLRRQRGFIMCAEVYIGADREYIDKHQIVFLPQMQKINLVFVPNPAGSGHEANAMEITRFMAQRYPDKNIRELKRAYASGPDFLILHCRAIQLASGGDAECAQACRRWYTKEGMAIGKLNLHKILKKIGCEDYQMFLFDGES